MDKWTSDDVYKWLQSSEIKLREQQAKIFKENDIDGSALLGFTEDRLEKDPFLLKVIGPRMRIIQCIQKFKITSGKVLLFLVEYASMMQDYIFKTLPTYCMNFQAKNVHDGTTCTHGQMGCILTWMDWVHV
jgi:hypothetical protein